VVAVREIIQEQYPEHDVSCNRESVGCHFDVLPSMVRCGAVGGELPGSTMETYLRPASADGDVSTMETRNAVGCGWRHGIIIMTDRTHPHPTLTGGSRPWIQGSDHQGHS
jgi:hypothetical protein